MQITRSIGGFYIKEGLRYQLPLIKSPTITDILNTLDIMKDKTGILGIKNNMTESDELEIYIENDNYMATLMSFDEKDDNYYVRTLHNSKPIDDPNAPAGFSYMLGETYGSSTIVQDYELIKEIVLEFYETGDVSRDILD
ncbi:DUF6911 family protein [Wohlfahrtiimonas populi]|uniref:DUF6911 family protein n=1 Tax=Wohlfahrtiimonas populi TaxID=1940240 RepID=UPI00098D331D|nr:hypothetical protein [Wohlfahrtiimonas populi]